MADQLSRWSENVKVQIYQCKCTYIMDQFHSTFYKQNIPSQCSSIIYILYKIEYLTFWCDNRCLVHCMGHMDFSCICSNTTTQVLFSYLGVMTWIQCRLNDIIQSKTLWNQLTFHKYKVSATALIWSVAYFRLSIQSSMD